MGFLLRCRYWSVLVAIVVCKQGKISTAERAQGCVWSQLSLRCPEMKVIQITSVVLGSSNCPGSSCCIKQNDCTHDANANHRTDVHSRCDNKQSCTVGVLREKIPCGYWGVWYYNNFERITYNCLDYHRSTYDTMNNSTYEEAMEDDNSTDSESVLGFGTEIAQGCVGSQLNLRCEEMKVIEVIDVVVGDLNGVDNVCNISYSNCTDPANASHTMNVRRRCDGQRNCTVVAVQEDIRCGASDLLFQNDFEFITYNCINDSERIVQGCIESRLSLRCPEMKVIQVTAVVLGDSYCFGTWCCITGSDCTHNSSVKHRTDVHRKCDNKHSCTVTAIKEQIPCGWRGKSENNDFERIAYNCINDTRNIFTSTPETDRQTGAGPAAPEFNSQVFTVVIVIICPIILLVIVMLIVVIYRRKKKRCGKSLTVVKMSDMKTNRNETNHDAQGPGSIKNIGSSASICRNDNSKEVENSLNCVAKNFENQSSDYCELERVITGRIQSESEYEELKHGRNYEPLILYEQLQSPLSGTFIKT